MMNLATATPREIDTVLAEMYPRWKRAVERLRTALVRVRRANGERPQRYDGVEVWERDAKTSLDIARSEGDGIQAAALAAYDEAEAALDRVCAEMAPYEDEYRRRLWNRFFEVPNGHVHQSMSCSTCNRGRQATEFGWHPDLSGKSEAEAVAELGPLLCTVCFPSAPVAWTVGRPKPARCAGSGGAAVAGSVSRYGMRWYGDCPSCADRPLLTQAGVLRGHKPKAGK